LLAEKPVDGEKRADSSMPSDLRSPYQRATWTGGTSSVTFEKLRSGAAFTLPPGIVVSGLYRIFGGEERSRGGENGHFALNGDFVAVWPGASLRVF
jgi:hypothetical protein